MKLFASRRNQSGQMAIFVALLFQLLFVFFAMVINVGLLVHDKINLQNSVDIAAIYAAQKQAEILNAIAHTNYQIRQSWKLLAWRVRVLGDYGLDNHPSKLPVTAPALDTLSPHIGLADVPVVCVNHEGWSFTYPNTGGQAAQKTCHLRGRSVPALKETPVVTPFPWDQLLKIFVQREQKNFSDGCKQVGSQNWYMAAKWLAAYKLDVANRKQVIWQLADNLAQKDFRELTGGSVLEGVRKTLMANLTRSNRESIDEGSIEFINSLEGVPRQAWLPDILVNPIIYYMDSSCPGATRDQSFPVQILNTDMGGALPRHYQDNKFSLDPDGFLAEMSREDNNPQSPIRSIWGFEKNPWYMAYVGLKVNSRPKQPFSPFGKGVQMAARAFAQPFGGRIGPWLQKEWNPGDDTSSGDRVDPLSQLRVGSVISQDFKTMIPNFSRFPGDTLGLTSTLGLTTLREFNALPPPANRIAEFDYAFVPSDLLSPNGDVLAWNFNQRPPPIRSYEIAAIAPNFFDVMYYSIDPNYYVNYIIRSASTFFDPQFPLRQDLGGRFGAKPFTIQDQVLAVNTLYPNKYFYQITDAPGQLLTSWAPAGTVDYSRIPDTFAECRVPVPPDLVQKEIAVPGSCIYGGRSGYSVKIVSKSFLKSSDLELGGPGKKGPIRNPPPDEF